MDVDYSPAIIELDYTFLVPAGSTIHGLADLDRPGMRVAVVRNHASTVTLTRMLKQATFVYGESLDSTFELLRAGNAAAFASIREMLVKYSARLPGSRVVDDRYGRRGDLERWPGFM